MRQQYNFPLHTNTPLLRSARLTGYADNAARLRFSFALCFVSFSPCLRRRNRKTKHELNAKFAGMRH